MYIYIPFAYAGNPASESGPKAILSYLDKTELHGTKKLVLQQNFFESPMQFLVRVKNVVDQSIEENDSVVILGGNHLSIMPVYEYFYIKNSNILTLDAHRDYYPENEISHASFFSYITPSECIHYIVEIRDYIKHDNIIDLPCGQYPPSEFLESVDYIDIDLDVLDPITFSWCGSALDNGLQLEDVSGLIRKCNKAKVLSLSEYIPIYDNNAEGLEIIRSIILKFLK